MISLLHDWIYTAKTPYLEVSLQAFARADGLRFLQLNFEPLRLDRIAIYSDFYSPNERCFPRSPCISILGRTSLLPLPNFHLAGQSAEPDIVVYEVPVRRLAYGEPHVCAHSGQFSIWQLSCPPAICSDSTFAPTLPLHPVRKDTNLSTALICESSAFDSESTLVDSDATFT